jgi:hypothetical protein
MTLKDNNPGINPWLIINIKFNPELNHSTSVFKERRNYTYRGKKHRKSIGQISRIGILNPEVTDG